MASLSALVCWCCGRRMCCSSPTNKKGIGWSENRPLNKKLYEVLARKSHPMRKGLKTLLLLLLLHASDPVPILPPHPVLHANRRSLLPALSCQTRPAECHSPLIFSVCGGFLYGWANGSRNLFFPTTGCFHSLITRVTPNGSLGCKTLIAVGCIAASMICKGHGALHI